MKLARCPVCHCNLNLDALVQDKAGQELLGAVARLPDFVAKPLVSYLALFRPAKQDLSNIRAHKLVMQVLDMYRADHVLASALAETVAKLREKRQAYGDAKPLSNHNYLKQVYKSVATKNGANPDGKGTGEVRAEPKQDDSDWYFSQAKKMVSLGQDPLQSSIGGRLRELGWEHPSQ